MSIINTGASSSISPYSVLNTLGTTGATGASAIATPAVGATYANGITITGIYAANGINMLKVKNPSGKEFFIDGSRYKSGTDLNNIPSKIVNGMPVNGTLTRYDSPNANTDGSNPQQYFTNLYLGLLPNGQRPMVVIQEANSQDFYAYYNNSAQYSNYPYSNGSYVGTLSLSPYNEAEPFNEVPQGRRTIFLQSRGRLQSFPGATEVKSFTKKSDADAYVAANPGSTLKDLTTQTNLPPITVLQAELQKYFAEGWKTVGSPISKTVELAPPVTGVLQNSDEYKKLTAEGYTFTQTGTKTITITPAVDAQVFGRQTQAQIDELKKKYPNLTIVSDGVFTKDTVIKDGTVYNNSEKITVGSDLYKKLQAEGWNLKATDPLITTSTKVVEQRTGLSKAETDALLADKAWSIVKQYDKVITAHEEISKTVSLSNLTEAQLEQYKNLTGYKIVKENITTKPGGTTTLEQSICNNASGILSGLINSDDVDKATSVSEVNQEYIDPKLKISTNNLFAKPGNAAADEVANGKKNRDEFDQYFVAGDPHYGGVDGNYAITENHPLAGVYNMLEGGDADSKFTFAFNAQVETINSENRVAHSKYGGTFSVDGKEYNVLIEGGKTEVTYPDGTKKTINPGDTFVLPEGSSQPLVEIKKVVGKSAGKNGADEDRMGIYINEPPSKKVIEDLKAKGFTEAEILAAGTVKHELELGFREVGPDGAYTSESAGVSGDKRLYSKNYAESGDSSIKNYYDLNYVRKEPPNLLSKTTTQEEICKTYNIEYTVKETVDKDCVVTCYDLKKTEEVKEETSRVIASKDKTVTESTPAFKGTVPGKPAVTEDVPLGTLKKERVDVCYTLNKTVENPLFEVCKTLPDVKIECWNGHTISPLAIDLNGDGVKTIANPWKFDLDADGTLDTWNASLSKKDGWLTWDRNKDGIVNDGSELFGNVTGGGQYSDGLAALSDYAERNLSGSSKDGKLSLDEIKKLEASADLRIQITDANGNKVLRKPSELGITELQLSSDPNKDDILDDNGVWHGPRTNVVLNGSIADMDDLWFSRADESLDNSDNGLTVTDKDDPFTVTSNNSPPSNYNPWLYNYNGLYQPPMNTSSLNQSNMGINNDPMQLLLSSMGGVAPNAYGFQQQQQFQMQQQFQQLMMSFYLQALIASLMPQFSGQQQPAQAQQYNPLNFY